MFTKANIPVEKADELIINPKYWVLVALCVLGGGIFATILAGQYKNQALSENLLNRVETIAASFNAEDIKILNGDISDLDTLNYSNLKSKMTALKSVNHDARFVYLMGYSENENKLNKLFFFVDSEPVNSPDYSGPGDVYDETTPQEIQNFLSGVSYIEGPYTDKWGSWVSGYAPIFDPATLQNLAIIGIDINSNEWQKDILYAEALPASLTVSTLLIILLLYISRRRKAESIQRRLEFISVASHQMRTPLSSIKWATEILLANKLGELKEEQKEYIRNIYDSNQRMIHLVGDFLQSSRISRGKSKLSKEPIDIVPLIESIKIDLISLSKMHEVEVLYDQSFPQSLTLNIDPKGMREVLANLLSNAIKYSRENGKVEIGYKEMKQTITIYIKDFGLGIPLKFQGSVFERFSRAENAVNKVPDGNGLGLYIAKEIVERHGGKLYFESTENVGTTFFIEMPKS